MGYPNLMHLAFGCSYTVPQSKLQDTRTKAVTTDDFRGIAISPIISKTFEHCVLKKFGDFFHTHENQYGFKKGRGCDHAILKHAISSRDS